MEDLPSKLSCFLCQAAIPAAIGLAVYVLTSSNSSKKKKTKYVPKGKYEIHYFPGFSGRAEPILMLLEDAGIEYDFVRGGLGFVDEKNRFSNFARPCLKEGDFILGQTSAILQCLGRRHGYDVEDENEQAHVNQLCNNAADIWSDSYLGKMGNKGCGAASDGGKVFLESRLDQHLGMAERNLCGSAGPYFFADRVTYADFALFNALRTMRFMFKGFDEKLANYKSVCLFEQAMCARPNLAKFLKNADPLLYSAAGATAAS